MASKLEIGQKVVITPAKSQPLSPRDSSLEPYAGRSGRVTDYYWISPNQGEAFYIYTVRIDDDQEEIVLHEDELEAYLA